MSSDVFNGLENINFSVLNDLFNTSVGGKINPYAGCSVAVEYIQLDDGNDLAGNEIFK